MSPTTSSQTIRPDGTKKVEIKLPTDLLELGMHVVRLDREWTELPFLLQEVTIKTRAEIEIFQTHCEYVFIEVDEVVWIEKYNRLSDFETIQIKPFEEKVSFRQELPKAQAALKKADRHIASVLDNVNNGEAFSIEESRTVVRECINSIVRNANAMLWLTKIKDEDRYTLEHCVRVGALAIAFGRFLGLQDKELELIGLCGMLHDVGKIKIPPEILNKPGKLSDVEYEIMKTHAILGKEVLEEIEGVPELIKDTAQYHHERVDGLGYPAQQSSKALHQYIRMITIVDVYDAITSDRCYQKGRSAFEALRVLFQETKTHFDKRLAEAFIRMVGIYPPGTLVEMTNGEVGIVVSSNPNSRLKPRVELVMDREKRRRQPYIVNLAEEAVDRDGELYAIESGLADASHNINLEDYVMAG